jgi:hypothetical protein
MAEFGRFPPGEWQTVLQRFESRRHPELDLGRSTTRLGRRPVREWLREVEVVVTGEDPLGRWEDDGGHG